MSGPPQPGACMNWLRVGHGLCTTRPLWLLRRAFYRAVRAV